MTDYVKGVADQASQLLLGGPRPWWQRRGIRGPGTSVVSTDGTGHSDSTADVECHLTSQQLQTTDFVVVIVGDGSGPGVGREEL